MWLYPNCVTYTLLQSTSVLQCNYSRMPPSQIILFNVVKKFIPNSIYNQVGYFCMLLLNDGVHSSTPLRHIIFWMTNSYNGQFSYLHTPHVQYQTIQHFYQNLQHTNHAIFWIHHLLLRDYSLTHDGDMFPCTTVFLFLCYVLSVYSREHTSSEVIIVYHSGKFKHAIYGVFRYSHVTGTGNRNCSTKGIVLLIKLTVKCMYITKISTSTFEKMSISFKQYKRKMTFFILSVLQDVAQQH
jgi:hypothetical protein